MNWLLLVLLCINVSVLVSFAAGVLILVRRVRGFMAFFEPMDEPDGKLGPSPLARMTGAVADQIATSIMTQAKTTFMGVESGAKRREKALQSAIIEDGASQASPLLGSIMRSFPSVGRAVKKNPDLLGILLQQLTNRSPSANAEGEMSPNNGSGEAYRIQR